jgi:hypothetical protein
MGVELALVSRAQDGRENLLGLRAARRAVAAADLPRDDRWPKGLFGAPVGGIDLGRVKEKREERRPLDGEVRGKAAHIRHGARMIEKPIELLEQPATRHGQPVRRHATGDIAVAQCERVLQHIADGQTEAGARVIGVPQVRLR